MKKLNLGVIGVGGRGSLANYAHNPEDDTLITAGMDVSQEALKVFSEKYNNKVSTYTNYIEMLDKENLDGVFITSPDFCHEEQAIAALERKIPVYLEKPMAITIEGCDRILKVAEKNKAGIVLGHNMRYMNFVLKMKEIIDEGTIGDVKAVWCRHFVSYGGDAYFRDWHSEQKYSNSLLLQKGAHDIDIIHWLAGGYTKRVTGFGKLDVYDKCPRRKENEKSDVSFNSTHWPPLEQTEFSPKIDIEDHNMILMNLDNGVQASYLQCHYTPDSCRNYTIIGTKGRIENYGDAREAFIQVWTTRKDNFSLMGDNSYRICPPAGSHGGADPKIVKGFIEYIRGESIPHTSPVASRNSVATGCKGAESIRANGIPMDIPPLSEKLLEYEY
ncbi:MAG: Gfo/Idh/MocA family oxidoreductase [Verrucomicrobiota bacterium]|nr:Gfo/Idh/MocA family oxidoreductase [Verrucomicrobiota bacterium]